MHMISKLIREQLKRQRRQSTSPHSYSQSRRYRFTKKLERKFIGSGFLLSSSSSPLPLYILSILSVISENISIIYTCLSHNLKKYNRHARFPINKLPTDLSPRTPLSAGAEEEEERLRKSDLWWTCFISFLF